MIYLAIYVTLLLFGLFTSGQKQAQRVVFYFAGALLFAFAAFRYRVGCDWYSYEISFLVNAYTGLEEFLMKREPGYGLSVYALNQMGLSSLHLNVLMAAIFFYGLITLANRQPNPLAFLILSFPVLIINMPMSALRQGAAIGLICVAFVAFSDRRLIRFAAFVFFASLFHNSAFIFMGLAPFVRNPLNRNSAILAGLLVLPGLYFLFSDTAQFYADRYVEGRRDAAGALYRIGMLAVTAAYFFLSLRKEYRRKFPYDYQLALIGCLLMLPTLPLIAVSSIIADRFAYYLNPIQIMVLARIPYLVSGRFAPTIGAAPYVALGLVLAIWTSYSLHFQKCYLPYQSWLFGLD